MEVQNEVTDWRQLGGNKNRCLNLATKMPKIRKVAPEDVPSTSEMVILFPYRRDPKFPGHLLIVDDYNDVDGIMKVPPGKTTDFNSYLGIVQIIGNFYFEKIMAFDLTKLFFTYNCGSVLSDLLVSNLTEPNISTSDMNLAIRNSSKFVNYLGEQKKGSIKAIHEIESHQDGIIMSENEVDSCDGSDNTIAKDCKKRKIEEKVDIRSTKRKTAKKFSIRVIQVKAVDSVNETYELRRTSKLYDVLDHYCRTRLKCKTTDVRFFYKNRLLHYCDTVQSLQMEESDIIRCFDAKFIETYTVNCLIPFMKRNGLTTSKGTFISELVSISPSFPDGFPAIKRRKKSKDSTKFLASLKDENLNSYMKRFLTLSRRRK